MTAESPCGTRRFHKFADGPQLRAQFLDQDRPCPRRSWRKAATPLGNWSRNLCQQAVAAVEPVNFVEDHDGRLARRADFRQHRVDRGDLLRRLRMADVHHMQQQVGLDHFLQRRLEGLHQAVRQFADETHRVGQEYILVGRQPQPPRGRVQRGEQFVLRQRVRAGQGVEQGGFAGVGVADDRGQGPGLRCRPLRWVARCRRTA